MELGKAPWEGRHNYGPTTEQVYSLEYTNQASANRGI